MAVYEGARPRNIVLPRRGTTVAPLRRPQAPAIPRRRARATIRANRRPRLVGFVLGTIVIAFVLSFFSLVLTVRVSASGLDMQRLDTQYRQLVNERGQILSDLDRFGRESSIRRQAISGGLTQLPQPVVIPAR